MKRRLVSPFLALLIVPLLIALGGCPGNGGSNSTGTQTALTAGGNRGTFTPEACAESERVATPDSVLALYFDKDGKVVGTQAENMAGTMNDRMCPLNPPPGGGSLCPGTYCPIFIPSLGMTFCKPPPC